MRDLEALIGKVVTVKSSTGLEFIGTLSEVDREYNTISLVEPRAISMSPDEMVRIMPYTLTSNSSLVSINLNLVLTVISSMEQTAEDYRNMISAEFAAAIQNERDAVEKDAVVEEG